MSTMKQITLPLAAAFVFVAVGSMAGDVVSLRGEQELAAESIELTRKDELLSSGGFERSWKLQPPAIPHKTDNDRITLKENSCLSCHSTETFEKEKAPKIGDSHFVDAEGVVLTEMNKRRYFCSQCHVSQTDAEPLVDNLFAGDQ